MATVADSYGVLVHSMASEMSRKDDASLTPSEWMFQYFEYRQQLTPQKHAEIKSRLERAAERDTRQSDLWACLAQVYTDEHAFGFKVDATSLDRALAAARRAVELDRANQFALLSLAQAYFFRQDLAAFRPAAEQAMALNPLNTDAVGILGLQVVHTGEFQRGAAIMRRAMELNPNHAGWMHFGPIWEHFERGEYERALDHAMQVNMPSMFWQPLVIAAIFGQLGRRAEAAAAVKDLLALDPGFASHARREIGVWHFASGLLDRIVEGVSKAGLEIATERETGSASGAVRADEGFWVAVLPFKYSGGSADLTALAEGMTEDIVTGLSRFSYLKVIARSSTERYAHEAVDVRSAGKELGARYAMEGTLRLAGTKLRLAAQLVDTTTGAHLWAETYNRPFNSEAIFELQDELVPRIVSTVADSHGVLLHSMGETLRSRGPDELSPYEAVLRSFGYFERVNAEELAAARSALERAVRKAPEYADAWAMLALLCAQEYGQGYSRADSLADGSIAARRAVEAGPSNHLAHSSLAQVLFLQKEFQASRNAAGRAVELNPMDGATVALMGILLAYSGEWERGCAVAEGAMRLNPHFPGWYRLASIVNSYRTGDYRGAVEAALRIQMPGYFWTPVFCAAAYGQLGEREPARKALEELLAIRPAFGATVREELGRWHEPELVEHFIDGLRKAGLSIPAASGSSDLPSRGDTTPPKAGRAQPGIDSGQIRADEGFWVAVLPFKHGGGSAEVSALAEGITEEIVTGLSRFSYLKVVARSSTARDPTDAVDVRSAGKELGARYVMEGSLRQAGSKLRLAVQLVDTTTGAHLWAENYERTFAPDAVFDLQDELVPRIVATVADINGVLARSMAEAVRSRAPEELSPYEAVLRSFGYFSRVTAEELAAAQASLELAVRKSPGYADAWAMLALLCVQDYGQGFDLKPDALTTGLAAAQKAVECAPSNSLAHFSLAQAFFFQKQAESFRNSAERAVALNPMDGNAIALLGELFGDIGDRDRGLELSARAKQLNPNHPGWYWYADYFDAYRRSQYRDALGFVLKANLPGHWGFQAAIAAACGKLGEQEPAARALKELHKIRPDFAVRARADMEKWFDPEYIESMIDGWRKAGLDIERSHPAPVAIAVLPFSDMSPAKDQEYLCEGMAEEIMNALVRVPGIRVASRTSAFRARHEGKSLPEIARLLSVNQILEGSVRSSGSRLRVTAQLTDVATGFQLWSERFDRDASDIFAMQDEIAAGVVAAVQARLAPGTHVVPTRPQPANLEAYRCYLRGRHFRGKEHLDRALEAFEEAVRLDPGYAASWTSLAEATVLASVFGLIPARRACETARTAVATANRLQGESADGLHVEGFVAWIERRWVEMETAWRRAIELQPGHVLALASLGIVLCTRQRLDEALPILERARQADPLSSLPYALTGGGLLGCGRPREALRYLEDALSFAKDDATALDNAGIAKVALGRIEEGIATLEHGAEVTHRGAHFLGTLGWALAVAGRKDEARAILEELRARPKSSPTVASEAWLLGALGEVDAAFEVVARAEDEHVAYVYFTGLPGFDPIRGDPRFAALEKRLGLPPSRAGLSS
ncbi:MAG: tetratricopeptide repeat protein [Thermoanaerobaculia bacterium]